MRERVDVCVASAAATSVADGDRVRAPADMREPAMTTTRSTTALALAIAVIAALLAVAPLTGPAPASAATTDLPGGTPIEATFTTPDGTVVPSTATTTDVTFDVALSEGIDEPDTALIYAIDLSGSTTQSGCGGDANGDTFGNRILDCEVASIVALNDDAIASGKVLEVGVVAFAELAAAGDVGPAPGPQALTGPDTDADANGTPDVEEVVRSARNQQTPGGTGRLLQFTHTPVGNVTNHEAAVQQACTLAANSTASTRYIVLLSDGRATQGGFADDDAAACDATIFTFAAGLSGSIDCDNANGPTSTLRQIAQASGGTCTEVTSLADLPDIVDDVVGSTLEDVTIDGVDVVPAVAGAAEVAGPIGYTAQTATVGLAPGPNTFTLTATGRDVGGQGSVSDTVTVIRNTAPSVTATDQTVDEGDTAILTASGTDADGDPLTYEWDLDGDTTFEATGTSVSVPTVDGPDDSRAVSVRACDGTECGAPATVEVTVDNVAPTVDAGADQTVGVGESVTLIGTFNDPAGAADEGYTWDFGGLASGVAAHGDTLATTTSFPTPGTYPLTLAVTDDDGATGTATTTITVVNTPPDCSGVSPSLDTLWPPNHQMVTVTLSGATDADGDAVTITVDSVFQDEPVDGTGDGSTGPDAVIDHDQVDLRAERSGNGDGRVYHVGFSAADGTDTCSGTVTVTVDKNRGRNGAAVDQGPLHDSTIG